MRTAQTYGGGIGNYVNSTDTGVYDQTVTLTFYQADRSAPVPAEPDEVVGLGERDASTGTPVVHLPTTGLPRNITRAYLEVYIKGNGCDEQWFTAVPDDLAAKDTAAGLCGHGAYREVDAAIDGRAAGVTQYFPYIYTGGIVPTLWRPIPAVGTFDMSPELMDVTPFAGQLVDGGSHDIALSVANIGDTWNLSANLVLFTDHHAAQTTGAVTADTIAPTAVTRTTERDGTAGAVTATTTATRDWTLAGYVATSAGRVTTSVSQHAAFRNADTVTNNGFAQQVGEVDAGWNTSQVSVPRSTPRITVHAWSYPVTVTENAQVTDDNNFNLSGKVDLTRALADRVGDGRGWTTLDESSDEVNSSAIDQRANGVTVQADGTASEHYLGTDDLGGWYDHYLAAAHGYVTVDRLHHHP